MPRTPSLSSKSTRPERKRRWDRNNMFRSTRPRGRLSAQEVEEMRARRASGQTVGQIADEMGCNYHTVSRRTQSARVDRREIMKGSNKEAPRAVNAGAVATGVWS